MTPHFTIRAGGSRSALVLAIAALLLIVQHASSRAADAPTQAVQQSPAACRTFRVRDQDEIWLVSTRHLGCPWGYKYVPNLRLWRYQMGTWVPATQSDFYAGDSADIVTAIYIHGNRIDSNLASSYGLDTYFELVGKLDYEPPVRYVIWSWPADQIKGPLRDVRQKAERSDTDAVYLGHFLAGLKPEVRVGLVSYSLGGRISSGAMHMLHGGGLFGQSLMPAPRPAVHVAMWAAAEHNHWYLPGNTHDRALNSRDAWFITVNPCDPILSRYRFIEKCSNPEAVGCVGIYGRNLLPSDVNAQIEVVNVSNIVGNEHHWRPYLYSPYIQNRTRDYILWHLPSAAPTPLSTVAAQGE